VLSQKVTMYDKIAKQVIDDLLATLRCL